MIASTELREALKDMKEKEPELKDKINVLLQTDGAIRCKLCKQLRLNCCC